MSVTVFGDIWVITTLTKYAAGIYGDDGFRWMIGQKVSDAKKKVINFVTAIVGSLATMVLIVYRRYQYRRAMHEALENAEPLNEVCEHGCHIDDTYGFVVMMGCPEHD